MANKPEAKEYAIEHDAKNTNVSPMHYVSSTFLGLWETCYVSDVEMREKQREEKYI